MGALRWGWEVAALPVPLQSAAGGGAGADISSQNSGKSDLERNMNKMNCILISAFITLVVFCSSGYSLRCYTCDQSPVLCKTNGTCIPGEDACLQIRFTKVKTYACWKSSRCNINEIASLFHADNFEYFCCQTDMCNKSPTIVISKTAFSVATIMTMIWILCF
ncbi:CD59 glycoprotein [Alligator mississippiensis]|uniref:CD59 glycoprotein n=1 Tax=Alligator mississippiensis TaxID=8496 RepID=UPI0007114714|nr:CD59 glycoprotein [Alligator mississippiensis]